MTQAGEADAPAETSYVTEEVQLNKSDICIMTNACMTDSATLGSLYKPAPAPEKKPISGELWAKVAGKKSGTGKSGAVFLPSLRRRTGSALLLPAKAMIS